jgi:hypothetical protein
MNSRLVAAVLLTFAVGLATRAEAQTAPTRPQGFWIAFGFGWSSLGYSCDNCTGTSRTDGVAAQVRLGTALSRNFLVGADIESWNKSEGGKWAKSANWTAAAYWYPMESANLYVKGGVGLSTLNGTISGYTISGSGLGFTAGLGYDIRLSRSFWLTPTASYFYGSVGDVNTGSVGVVKGWKQNALNVALDMTFP